MAVSPHVISIVRCFRVNSAFSPMLLEKYNFDVFADYFSFYLQDEQANYDESLIDVVVAQTIENLFAVTPRMIHIGTVRNMTVPFTVEIHDGKPKEDFALWEQVNECSIEIPSGTIVVRSNDYFPEAPRIKVAPDVYRARIFYDGLNTLSEDGLDGDDKYKVILWRGETIEPQVLKQRAKE